MRRSRGHILLVVLLVFMLMMALVSGVASTAYLVQRSVDDYTRQRVAENLGDSLVATAVAQLRQDSSFAQRLDLSDGYLTFDPKDPWHSTNNILGDGSKEGLNGSVVPAGTAQLAAVSSLRGRRFVSLVNIGKSPFPYVVASAGAFTSNGSLLLGALRSLDDLKDGLTPVDLVKGSLLANASLTITGPAQVVGDLKTAATAHLSGVTQDGKLEENAKPEDVPQIRLTDYDPAGKPEIIDFNIGAPPSANAPLYLSGLARYHGALTLNKGVDLNGGVLYVDGDLTIAGGVKGYGAIFCTGKLVVSGGGTLTSDSLCALVAGGDLSISGAGADKTQYRGLVYSAGAISVSDITVIGSLVGSSTSGASMTVTRSNLVFDPKAVVMDLDLQWSGFGPLDPQFGGATLRPGFSPTPASLFRDGAFQLPTDTQIQQALWFTISRKPARTWDQLTPAEQLQQAQSIEDVKLRMRTQVSDWNAKKLTPENSSARFHLDLNRFMKVQSRMKILTRRLVRI